MKQTQDSVLKQSKPELERLKTARKGNPIGEFHLKLANDPALLKAFTDSYIDCCATDGTLIPRKYRELILMALCCASKLTGSIPGHAGLAMEHGASVEEVTEVLRLVLNVCGTSALIPAMDMFEAVDPEKLS